MTNKKTAKRLLLATLSASLLLPAYPAMAAQVQTPEQSQEQALTMNADGFEIQNGVLVKYTGTSEDVIVPDGVTSIGAYAFSQCTAKSITLPEGVTVIQSKAFWAANSLESVHLPNSLTWIESEAFAGCDKLQEIHLPNNITYIGDSAFDNCDKLHDIALPTVLIELGRYTFAGCRSLQSISLPANLSKIGTGAFSGCEKLTEIKISPDNRYFTVDDDCLFTAGKDKLLHCSPKKETLTLPNELSIIDDGACSGCKNLKSVTLPKDLDIIGMSAFSCCESLTNIVLPNSIEKIQEDAFSFCSNLRSVVLPTGIDCVDGNVFHCCPKLTAVFIPANVTNFISSDSYIDDGSLHPFYGSTKNLTIYGKKGSSAEKFAKKRKIAFQEYKGTPTQFGSFFCKKSHTVSYGHTPFSLSVVKADKNSTLTYKSSNKKVVTVDKKGTVTVKGTGIATITVHSSATKNVAASSANITVTVKPKTATLLSLRPGANKTLTVSWKKDPTASGYKVYYNTNKSPIGMKAKTIKKNSTTSTTLKDLKPGKKYYVSICATKTVEKNGKPYVLYGADSNTMKSDTIQP